MAFSTKAQPISSSYLVEPPSHFFKVILPSTLADRKLGIPGKFAKRFGNELAAVAELKVPNGRVWKIGLTKEGRKIWFQDGWREFVQYHSISAGYFLVFKYAKHSTFHVLVFDTSACEICYPYNNGGPGDDEKNPINLDVTDFKDSHDSEPESKTCESEEFSAVLQAKGIHITQKRSLIPEEVKQRAINIARLITPKNPSFMVVLLSNNIYKSQLVTVPTSFVNKYMSRNAKVITLQLSDGREWTIRITWTDSICRFTRKWNAISEDQNLKKGDICLFELARTKDITLKLSVFHTGTNAT